MRRAYFMAQEQRGRVKTTPRTLEEQAHQAVREPFYLQELGLAPVVLRGMSFEPRYEPGPVIQTSSSCSSNSFNTR
ncbi:hypothetical protein SAMN00790413_05238 [Deinococcus hopiensis KR-140]|uniref:Uncharacterized protein n=1 Tax=Deinococcus hopiensis KR-140 TaxID=695939 RepID=A0A1W1UUD9_9DEIO|nr:hypothetical protein SAMN00790413_05238 [Deinococcus hopiensis KR-140]